MHSESGVREIIVAKIKVAQVITRMDWGGSPDIVRLLCRSFDEDKYEVTFICGKSRYPTGKTKAFFRDLKNKLVVIPHLKRNINPVFDLLALCNLYILFKRGKFDIVHTHTAKAGCLGRLAAKLAGIKVIIHTSHGHNFYGYFGPVMSKFIVLIERWLSTFTDKIVTLTSLEKKDLLCFNVVGEGKILAAHTAVDGQTIRKIDQGQISRLKKELRIKEKDIVIGMVGRLEQIKGVKYFVEAAMLIAEKFDNVQFVLVGEGSLKDELMKRVNKRGCDDRFIFCGWRDDATDIMCLMDIMVLASLNEAVGLVLIEAQSLGVPVIATSVGGIPEVVDEGKSGILVRPQNIKELQDAMVLLVQDESKRKAMGKAAAEFVRNKYDADDLCRMITQTYDMLLSRE